MRQLLKLRFVLLSLILFSTKAAFYAHLKRSSRNNERLSARRNWFRNLNIFGKKRMKKANGDNFIDKYVDDDNNTNVRPTSTSVKKPKGSIGETAFMMEKFKKAQIVGRKTEMVAQELSKLKVDGVSSNGNVRVYVDGQQRPIGVDIDETFLASLVLDPTSASDLSNAVTEAMQNAHDKSKALMKDKMQNIFSELGNRG